MPRNPHRGDLKVDPGRGLPRDGRPAIVGARQKPAPKQALIHNSKEIIVSTIVLVHGGFVDGSGWEPVYRSLRNAGHQVDVVQNPTKSLADDVAVTNRVLDQHEDVILVGHSYGGAVITEAGNHPNVRALVYIAAFAPDAGESVNTLIADPPPGAPVPPILPPVDGFLFLDRSAFRASFAGDVEPKTAEFMADSQVPWGVDALGGVISNAAWRDKESWYLLTTEDRMIPAEAQRSMSGRAGSTVVEVAASHAVYVSDPASVAAIIATAIEGSA
jgi:pimeloyl-ACP methyl ester carboxylesterase